MIIYSISCLFMVQAVYLWYKLFIYGIGWLFLALQQSSPMMWTIP